MAESPVCTINLSSSVAVRLSGYGTVLFFLALGILDALYGSGEYSLGFNRQLILAALASVFVYFGTLVLHEGVHGFFFWLFGGRPQYGVGSIGWFFPYAYATSPGDPFTFFQMTTICLAPFVVLSVGSLVLMSLVPGLSTLAGVAFVTNFSGAIGDLWLVRQIWRFRKCRDLWMADVKDGLAIYTSDPEAEHIATSLASVERGTVVTRLFAVWILASLIILTSASPLTIVLDLLNAGRVLVGPTQFPLFIFERLPQDGVHVSINLNSIIVAGLLFALLDLVLGRRKPRNERPATPEPTQHPALL